MHSAVTDMADNGIYERLLARRDREDFPVEDLVRCGKEMAGTLGEALDSSIVPGIGLEFAGYERIRSDAWLRTLAPNAGLVLVSDEDDRDAAAVLISADFAGVVSLASVALGGEPQRSAADRPLTGYEEDFLPLFGRAVHEQIAQMAPPRLRKVSGMPAGAFDQSAASSYPVFVLKYSVSFGEAVASMTIAIPEAGLRLPRARAKSKAGRQGTDPLASNLLSTRLRVEASVALPSTTLGKLGNLAVGDLIPIPVENFDRGALSTRGKPIFAVQIGHLDDAFSFRVLHPVKKAGDGFLHRVAESLSRGAQTDV